ncbi:MAG: alpha/beta fold hydrolase [Alphaproteobacteria bacterium]|nr:MAG: alpha/beta fold hydrolase [Alphaproteobacteria bacterium]
MADTETPVVLVHGAWHGGWCWEPFKPYLESRGLRPFAPDLPGHGQNRRPPEEVTLASYAEGIASVLDNLDEPAILVGHSMAGAVISEVAERRPDRVRALCYVTAFLLPDGVPMTQRMKEDSGSLAAGYVRRSPDGLSVEMPEEGLRAATYDGLSEALIAQFVPRLQPQAIAPMTTPVRLSPENFGRVPRAYIDCTRDKAITIEMQRRMQGDLPCDPVLTLDCGHMAPWIEPDAVADFIAGLA